VNALSPVADNAALNLEAAGMSHRPREASIPAMVLGACAVFATVASALYVGISPKSSDALPGPAWISSATPHDEMAAQVRSPQDWLAVAADKRHQHDYQGARAAYSELIRLNAMTADAWADYADTLASLSGGSLGGEAEVALRQALSLDPGHPKALWLEATRAYQEHRFAEALALWKRLRAILGPQSPDTAIIDANIAESEELARAPAG
jgi:hypothetical protein